jgi:glycosyltransferase involved in cell wall biosynthesis
MKILFLSYSFAPNIGGIESHSMILATELTKAGYEVCLLTMTEKEGKDNHAFRVVRNPSFKEKKVWYKWSDFIFENNPVLSLSLLNWWYKRPRITAIHTWIEHSGASPTWTSQFKKWWVRKAELTIVVSKALQKSIGPQSAVIPNPYQNDLFRAYPKIIKTKSFVFLGRLVSDKGLKVALEAIQLLLQSPLLSADEKKAVRLTIIGEGPQKEELIPYIQTLGITAKVDFLERLEGTVLSQTLNEHVIILIPSIWEEPFGMVALEAMACGCIPIASKSGGLPEAIGDAGLLFEKGNSEELARQMIRLLQDQSLQQQLRRNAKEHLAKHRAENIVSQYITYIEKFRKT